MLYKIFKFYLKKIDPELAHKLAIVFIKISSLLPTIFSPKIDKNLHTNLFHLSFKSPIGLAAGFDKNAQIYNHTCKLGFGFSEIGTITPKPQEGNPRPRVFRLIEDKAIINRLGFPNDGIDIIKKRIKHNMPKGICGINIGPNKENATLKDDYLRGFDEFFSMASYITINISSPNTPNLRMNHDEGRIINLIDSLQEKRDDKKSKVPIIFKISPDIEDFEIKSLCEIFLEKKIDGVILTNTTVNHKENLGSDLKDEIGGLSGKPLNTVSNKIIQKFFTQLGHNIPIIGAGGVSDGQTALEKIKSGASLLQLYTSMVYSGPYVAHKINKELSYLIKKQGYKNISEAVGIYCKK